MALVGLKRGEHSSYGNDNWQDLWKLERVKGDLVECQLYSVGCCCLLCLYSPYRASLVPSAIVGLAAAADVRT
jgi:hypothetical protein